MDAALELEPAPGPASLKEEDRLFEPTHPGEVAVHHLNLPPLAFGVFPVHAGQISGEEAGLIASRPGADLDEHVLVVVGVLRQEEPPQRALQRQTASVQLVHFRLGQLAEFAVRLLGKNPLGVVDLAQDALIGIKGLDDEAQP